MVAVITGRATPPHMIPPLKPLLITAAIAIVAVEIWGGYIRPMIFKTK